MRILGIFIFILLIGLTVSSHSSAELVAEESVDDKWAVNFITENSVHATVNRQVTHGDGLHARMVKGEFFGVASNAEFTVSNGHAAMFIILFCYFFCQLLAPCVYCLRTVQLYYTKELVFT